MSDNFLLEQLEGLSEEEIQEIYELGLEIIDEESLEEAMDLAILEAGFKDFAKAAGEKIKSGAITAALGAKAAGEKAGAGIKAAGEKAGKITGVSDIRAARKTLKSKGSGGFEEIAAKEAAKKQMRRGMAKAAGTTAAVGGVGYGGYRLKKAQESLSQAIETGLLQEKIDFKKVSDIAKAAGEKVKSGVQAVGKGVSKVSGAGDIKSARETIKKINAKTIKTPEDTAKIAAARKTLKIGLAKAGATTAGGVGVGYGGYKLANKKD